MVSERKKKKIFKSLSTRTMLFILGSIALFMLVLLKKRSLAYLGSDPLLFSYAIFITTFELSRVTAAMLYKHSLNRTISIGQIFSGIKGKYEPKVSFVIPCKNEEAAIENTITKCYQADYPKDKIEVIVINDGSTDRTIDVLKKLKDKYRNLIIVDWKVNRGKRHGMAEGFRRATGEIVIQLDSDSYIEPSSFRHLITPFKNPKIGAVCAHADPDNADKNIITRTQAAYYFMSFRILKAAESTFLKVFCCSGCSSAYRKEVVLPILDQWLGEKFLGKPVTWGDDRSLTSWVLRQDHDTIYSDDARAYTIVPDTIKKFAKQQVRWKKSWVINSFFTSKFIAKKDLFVSLFYFFPLILVTFLTPFMAIRALVYYPVFKGVVPILYIGGVFLIAVIMTLYYRFISLENKYWPYVFVWAIINTVLLSSFLLYSILTIQDRGWGTR